MEEVKASVTVDKIFQYCTEKSLKQSQPDNTAIHSVETYQRIWESTIHHLIGQFELGKSVYCSEFGVLGYHFGLEIPKTVCLNLDPSFLNQFNFKFYHNETEITTPFTPAPSTRLNIEIISKQANADPQTIQSALTNIWQSIGEILKSNDGLEVDLGSLGRLINANDNVIYSIMSRQKPTSLLGRSTVKSIMELTKQADKLQPLLDTSEMHDQLNYSYTRGRRVPKIRQRKGSISTTVTNEMLGGGMNPNARNQRFSSFTDAPDQLVTMRFKKPSQVSTRFPPVLDTYSRTRAAPLEFNRQYLSPSVRIASYYNPSSRQVIFDNETRSIKFLQQEQQKMLGSTVNPLIPQLSSKDDRIIQATGIDQDQLKQDYTWKRYQHYIEYEISTDQISSIRQYWIHHILDHVPNEMGSIPRFRIDEILDQMLNEVNKDYYLAVRKSIIDYVLKSDDQKRRLGFEYCPDPPEDYGSKPYEGIVPDEEWQNNVMSGSMIISDTLCICSPATLGLNLLWADYEDMLLVDLPGKFIIQSCNEFIERQDNRMGQVRSLLVDEWTKRAIGIIQEDVKQMTRDQATQFYRACSTLMSNQLRQLITASVDTYVQFFSRFDLAEPPTPEIMTADNPQQWPNSFIRLKMGQMGDGKFSFTDDLQTVQQQLKEVLSKIAQQSDQISRPDILLTRNGGQQYLSNVEDNDYIIKDAEVSITGIIKKNLEVAKTALNLYDKYIPLLTVRREMEKFVQNKSSTLKQYQQNITKYIELEKEIRETSPIKIRLNMVDVECNDIIAFLCRECEEIISLLCKAVLQTNLERATNIYKGFEQIVNFFQQRSDTAERLVENESFRDEAKDERLPKLFSEYDDVKLWLGMLRDAPFYINEEDLGPIKSCHISVNKILGQMDDIENRLRNERDQLQSQLKDTKKNFSEELQSIENEINSLRHLSERPLYKQYCEQIAALKQRIEDCQNRMEDINHKEELLGWTPTEFTKLEEARVNIKPYDDLWRLVLVSKEREEQCKLSYVKELDPEEIEREFRQLLGTSRKLLYNFKDKAAGPADVAKFTLSSIDEFMRTIPVMKVAATRGLEERHFDKICEIMGEPRGTFKIDNSTTFKTVLTYRFETHLGKIEDVAQLAAREFNNLRALDNMEADWETVAFELKLWQESETFIHLGQAIEAIQQLLDEQILLTQTMKSSPYAQEFLSRILSWEEKLQYTNESIDIWIKVQTGWIALEPVFASADIRKQLFKEAALFQDVDDYWRMIMEKTNKDTLVNSVMKIDNLLGILKESHEKIEVVQHGLNNYLEKKRLLFPRFFFLANEDLLSILKETRDPKRVKPHLKKCFEAIKSLEFDEENKISAMISVEGEKVDFLRIVDPNAAEGAVERWLIEVEECMIKSTRDSILKALTDYPKKERKDWVQLHKGQAVLCVAMAYWTAGAEEKMMSQGKEGLQIFYRECCDLFNDIVDLVRGDIPELVRCTLKALIVLDVHARDMVKEFVDEGIEDKQDFSWLAQLRYYWENDDMMVRILNAELLYCYEYLGNSERLVITPLTDKCYRTLCGAVYLSYGGAPEGPAGTGKTETVKDLAKALARMCVVFNCSDGLDFESMGKFFKGLIATGGWSCFDEFNRIKPDVLSVIAQQLLDIQNAIKGGLQEFLFEGTMLPVRPTTNCFITMNPGYAGRSDLPDNLKALFRTVAMMVPNYALIAENVLYSYGFRDAAPLARKIVATYKLCSEQLSYQPHYDYGMRAVKSVLIAAGNLKRRYPEENEMILFLRSINDVNLAKFLSHDLPLFEGITSDLFPGITLPVPDYENLMECLLENCQVMNLQPDDYFISKVIQLYEMICVRHGLMIVGLPFSGKTSAIHLLGKALTQCHEKGYMNENEVLTFTLNPKAVTMEQLYGSFDEISKDWQDGVLARGYKDFARNDSNQRKWLIFDGPVDAIWIENMNTVLDDNKKLCLTSGEIISMSTNMNLIFEPMDLAVASPATVSRCGMVYVEPQNLGWEPLYTSWRVKNIPTTFLENEDMEVTLMIDWLLDPTLKQVAGKMRSIAPIMEQNLVVSLLRMFGDSIKIFNNQEYFDSIEEKDRVKIIDCLFIFCMTWSLGACVVTEHRRNFNIWMRRILSGDVGDVKSKGKKILPAIPESGSFYDYVFNVEHIQWRHWTEAGIIDMDAPLPTKIQANELVVPTVDTIRYTYLLEKIIKASIPVLFCGNTGTGKTIYVKDVIMSKLDQDVFISAEVGFSAQTTANQVQNIIDGKLDVRRKKGVYGPPPNKICVIFIDDLNMPQLEEWGAQPPIEIIRQYLDQGGWYELKEMTFKQFVETRFVSAMGPPGGARTFITPRLQRHLNLIGLADCEDDTLLRIFSCILHWFFAKERFNENITKVENKIVQATRDIYKNAMEKLLPTPRKSHYMFNLRDFAKVIFGICLSDSHTITETQDVVRLWVHEILRVFSDRLVDDDDRLLILNILRENTKRIFSMNFDTIFNYLDTDKDGKVETLDEIRGLMFGFLLCPAGAPQHYQPMIDRDDLQRKCEDALDLYNSSTTKPMDLVLFAFALEHLCRISRIISQPGGHALLVGVGGSGRQSLTRLAASMLEYEVVQIELTKNYNKEKWQENLKEFLKRAGGAGEPTVFLFTDSQIKDKSFLEDINTLLNTGEVPNLYPPEDKIEVCEMVRAAAKSENQAPDGTPSQLFQYFIKRCKKLLHVVLCFSPIGEAFHSRLRMFPSLVNCCTIDWFQEWPPDALVSVAQRSLHQIELEDQIKYQCVEMCQIFHNSTIEWSGKMLSELKRHYYVTPTSYLEMITMFKTLLDQLRNDISREKERFEIGYEKIITTEGSVEGMRASLTELQPKLEVASEETEKKMVIVEAQKAEAEKVKVVVEEEEAIARVAAEKAQQIKSECDEELSQCLPALNAALSALDTLKDDDINTIKKYSNPPKMVMAVMEAVCILQNVTPPKSQDPQTMKMVPNWWKASITLLNGSNFLKDLKEYNRNAITERQIRQLQKFVTDPEFNEDNIRKKVDAATAGLCAWVCAMEKYYHVFKIVEPRQKAQAEAESDYNKLMSTLEVKQAELKAEQDKVEALESDLAETKDKKDKLEQDVDDCKRRLIRAQQLIESLGGEKVAWKEKAKILGENLITLTGDVLISSGIIAYQGPFTSAYRQKLLEEWIKDVLDRKIPSSDVFSFANCLGDPVKIRSWNIDGLPRDGFSIDNGIIISKARRWPLMIDPECQANKWIKVMENKDNMLMIMKLTDDNFIRMLENCVSMGRPLLLENVGEELDPSLEPLLLKHIFKGMIKLGDKQIEYNNDFRLYITTRLRNPHYLPELSTKVSLLNFMITPEGLADQLLATVVTEEQPELAREKEQLIIQNAENQAKLKETQDKILYVLSTSQGNILDDDEAIQILSQSKIISNQIEEEQARAKITEEQIDKARMEYKPFSECIALLFFCITDLGNVEVMYQYSIDFFNMLFVRSIRQSEKNDDIPTRLQNLEKYFTKSLYVNICRSLFEKDRLLFAFTLALKFMEYNKELDSEELRFFMTGGISIDENLPEKPDAPWILDKMWAELVRLNDLPSFKGFLSDFIQNLDEWSLIYNNEMPYEIEFPGDWDDKLTSFQKLLVVRCIRPDTVVASVAEYVAGRLGREFIEPIPFNLKDVYKDSTRTTPLIFVLSPGSDPFRSLKEFADSKRKNLYAKSLGQGQGQAAALLITKSLESGDWVLLQNCNLAVEWMPTLEKIVSDIPAEAKGVGRDFRLWLTSYASPDFPVTLLQNGLKMTNEPPKGLKANLLGSFSKDFMVDQSFFNGCKQDFEWKKLVFGLCFFNAVLHERRLYGPLGWNISYEFTESDLRISVQQLQIFLNQYDNVPFKALKYLTGVCNFGGRVTDDKDEILIKTLLDDYYTEKIFDDDYRFGPGDIYYAPATGEYQDYVDYIDQLPPRAPPEIYGFHPNADITKNLNEANSLFDNLLLTVSTGSGDSGGGSSDALIMSIAENILNDFPEQFNEELAQQKYAPNYSQSMNTVFTQELIRFNQLTKVIKSNLSDISKAIKGQITMSPIIEASIKSLFDGKVPMFWMKKSYPSLKPLGGYITDLKQRLEFFNDWLHNGIPPVFNISRFYFPQGFLTGALQNYARKTKIPIDEIFFNFDIVREHNPDPPADGVIIMGMFLEGAKWDFDNCILAESDAKVLFTEGPTIHLIPATENIEFLHYACPLYRTSERRGILSTTGHSTNFVMKIKLASDIDQRHWIKRGVALLTQLDD